MEDYYIVTDGASGDILEETNTYEEAILWALKNKDEGAYGINKVSGDDEIEVTNVDELILKLTMN